MTVVQELAKKYKNLLVLQVDADVQSEIAESFDIEAVPSFVIRQPALTTLLVLALLPI